MTKGLFALAVMTGIATAFSAVAAERQAIVMAQGAMEVSQPKYIEMNESGEVEERLGALNVVITGKAISASEGISLVSATDGLEIGLVVNPAEGMSVEDCSNGEYVMTADVGNFIPDPNGFHYYTVPTLLSVKCFDSAE